MRNLLCGTLHCNSEEFTLDIVKKEFIIVRCLMCGKRTKIHTSHIQSLFGEKLNGEEIKRHFEVELEEIK